MLVFDVVFKFFTIVLDECTDWHRSSITQRADGAALNVVGDRVEHIEIIRPALSVFDPVHHAIQPAGTFAAWCTLAAGLFVIKIR